MSVQVSAERAERLWSARIILHPVTGALPPVPLALRDFCPAVSVDRGPFQRLDGAVDWGVQPFPQPPSETAFRTVVTDTGPLARVTDAAGNDF